MASVFGLDMGGLSGPSGFDLSGLGTGFLNMILFLLGFIALGVITYIIWNNSRYRYKIHIFENLGGAGYVLSGTDRARLVKMGNEGFAVLRLKKRKVLRTAYGRKMGHNLYWFAVGQDGYWYNFILGDLDAQQGMLDIQPIDRDMRGFHVAISRNAENRYNKDKFMDKYGGWILAGIFMLIILLGAWFLISKMGDISNSLNSAIQASHQLQQGQEKVLSALNNLIGNSGIRNA